MNTNPRELPEWLQRKLGEYERSSCLSQLRTAVLWVLGATAATAAVGAVLYGLVAWLAR